ncbi:hypothetical protein BDP27DRAFT_1367862 [Rhodocollybia butyracea]|uniref:Uncharacterized protein n=1 Tax=Rhodocollybia butyracea TaxID=206335 RepID=A0A9P5PHQ9_9AGAR|nr:hypothetical protein BDP27DRAFT_1367862 [Rhodocollybia butyracea]
MTRRGTPSGVLDSSNFTLPTWPFGGQLRTYKWNKSSLSCNLDSQSFGQGVAGKARRKKAFNTVIASIFWSCQDDLTITCRTKQFTVVEPGAATQHLHRVLSQQKAIKAKSRCLQALAYLAQSYAVSQHSGLQILFSKWSKKAGEHNDYYTTTIWYLFTSHEAPWFHVLLND